MRPAHLNFTQDSFGGGAGHNRRGRKRELTRVRIEIRRIEAAVGGRKGEANVEFDFQSWKI